MILLLVKTNRIRSLVDIVVVAVVDFDIVVVAFVFVVVSTWFDGNNTILIHTPQYTNSQTTIDLESDEDEDDSNLNYCDDDYDCDSFDTMVHQRW